jgi:hypothetical protein
VTPRFAAKRCLSMRRPLRGWRPMLAAYVLLAVAWPAAGPLPWLAVEHGALHYADRHEARHHADAQDADRNGSAAAEHEDGDVPGSPTHPLDHDCAQCQVLKHLARCVLPDFIAPAVPLAAGNPVQAFVAASDVRSGIGVLRPLIRAPPLLVS